MQNTRICHFVHLFIFFCLEYFHIIQYNTYKLENYVILTYYNTPTEHTPTLQKRKKKRLGKQLITKFTILLGEEK